MTSWQTGMTGSKVSGLESSMGSYSNGKGLEEKMAERMNIERSAGRWQTVKKHYFVFGSIVLGLTIETQGRWVGSSRAFHVSANLYSRKKTS